MGNRSHASRPSWAGALSAAARGNEQAPLLAPWLRARGYAEGSDEKILRLAQAAFLAAVVWRDGIGEYKVVAQEGSDIFHVQGTSSIENARRRVNLADRTCSCFSWHSGNRTASLARMAFPRRRRKLGRSGGHTMGEWYESAFWDCYKVTSGGSIYATTMAPPSSSSISPPPPATTQAPPVDGKGRVPAAAYIGFTIISFVFAAMGVGVGVGVMIAPRFRPNMSYGAFGDDAEQAAGNRRWSGNPIAMAELN